MRALTLLFTALLLPLTAARAQPVILVEAKIAQYREAAVAAREALGAGVVEVDPSAPDALERLKNAPVVIAVGQRALTLARSLSPVRPVVFCMVLGVRRDVLSGAVTGVPLETDPEVALQQIQAVLPAARRVGVFYSEDASGVLIAEAKRAAVAQGLTLIAQPVRSGGEIKDGFAAMSGKIDVLWLPPDPRLYSPELFSYLLTTSSERRLPVFGFLENFTKAGALGSVSPDYADGGRRAGKLATGILARPATARLPVPPLVFAPGNLSLNLKTAQALGLTIRPEVASSAKQTFR